MLTLHASKGWPVAMISGAITAHFLVGAAPIVYLPEAHRSIGLAQTTIIGAVLAGAGIVAVSRSSDESSRVALIGCQPNCVP